MAINKPDWDRLMDSATAKLPGASRALLKNEIFDVFHEFFELSNSWLEDIAVPILSGTMNYELVPSDGTIIRLIGVRDVNNVPQQALMPNLGTLSIVYPVTNPQTFTATVAKNVVLPTAKGEIPVAPDWILPKYGPSILDGVLGRMMTQVSKSYTNPPQGGYHLKRFLNAIAQARSETLHRFTFGAQAWSFPRQFGFGSQRGGFSTSNTGGF
jgi:hypothetical protein